MVLGGIVIVVVGILVINYFKDIETGITLPAGQETQEGPTITKDGKTVHIVQPGDSLWKVAERYYDSGYNWTDIALENDIANPELIEMDQELVIPNVEPKEATVTIAQEILDNQIQPISGATYTIATGDNLWDIAVRAYGDGYRWTDIAVENDLVSPSIIHAGNTLVLPR